MTNFVEAISWLAIVSSLVTAYDPFTQNSSNVAPIEANQTTAHISPELVNELKDFENLIPKTIIDEKVAEHYLIDGNFRTVLNYLRSEDFSQLQKQLLNVPEIIDVLEFLHLTAENTTTMHKGPTKMPTTDSSVVASLDEYSGAAVAADVYKRIVEMTTDTTGSVVTKPQTMLLGSGREGVVHSPKIAKTPPKQLYIKEKSSKNSGLKEHHVGNDDDDDDDGEVETTVNANSIAFSEQQPLVHIVLLQDLGVKAKLPNKGQIQQQQQQHRHQKYQHQDYNSYQHSSLGTFTSFVEEVLQHLPNAAYQKMITDKCQNNPNFAKFYQALRSPVFKPCLETIKTKPNIQNIVATLKAHGVDVDALETIGFKVISWGPHI